MQRIKKGDKIIVISGKDKGRSGTVLKVLPKDNKVVIENINIVKCHKKQTQKEEGGIVTKEAPIHVSNVALADPKTNKPTRIGFLLEGDKKFRIAKRSGEKIDA